MAKDFDDSDGVWRTISGRKVFIREGQSLSSAMKQSGKFKSKKQKLGNSDEDKEIKGRIEELQREIESGRNSKEKTERLKNELQQYKENYDYEKEKLTNSDVDKEIKGRIKELENEINSNRNNKERIERLKEELQQYKDKYETNSDKNLNDLKQERDAKFKESKKNEPDFLKNATKEEKENYFKNIAEKEEQNKMGTSNYLMQKQREKSNFKDEKHNELQSKANEVVKGLAQNKTSKNLNDLQQERDAKFREIVDANSKRLNIYEHGDWDEAYKALYGKEREKNAKTELNEKDYKKFEELSNKYHEGRKELAEIDKKIAEYRSSHPKESEEADRKAKSIRDEQIKKEGGTGWERLEKQRQLIKEEASKSGKSVEQYEKERTKDFLDKVKLKDEGKLTEEEFAKDTLTKSEYVRANKDAESVKRALENRNLEIDKKAKRLGINEVEARNRMGKENNKSIKEQERWEAQMKNYNKPVEEINVKEVVNRINDNVDKYIKYDSQLNVDHSTRVEMPFKSSDGTNGTFYELKDYLNMLESKKEILENEKNAILNYHNKHKDDWRKELTKSNKTSQNSSSVYEKAWEEYKKEHPNTKLNLQKFIKMTEE